MKKIYQINVKAFVKATKQNSNHMHLACILVASWTPQMEVELVKMQAEYYEDGRFWLHDLTSWPKISKIFLNNLSKMAKNVSIDSVTHPKPDWEYVMTMSKKTRELLWPTLQPFTQTRELCFICCSPFGPKGAWIWSTCQHVYHPQCLIILMVAKNRCPQCSHFIDTYMNNSIFKWACHNIGSTICLTHPIGHKHGV
jgi:hypothetical protein